MKLTNNFGLPEPIYRAIEAFDQDYQDSHDKPSDYSVTQLLSPPQIVALTRQHQDELTEDVSDRIFALLGNAVHMILERSAHSDHAENRVYGVHPGSGCVISGQYDHFQDGVLSDYKVMSVFEVMNGGLKPEKAQQLNLLAWLLRMNGQQVTELQVVSIYRDWSKGKARGGGDYPRSQVQVHTVPAWSTDSVEGLLADRIALHQAAKAGDIPDCTLADRLQDPTKFAVMVKGGKRSKKNHLLQADAQQHAERIGGFVELRKSEPKRCQDYCGVAQWCPQYQGELNA